MKYLSIDIETTGLDTENNDILEIGGYVEDTKNLLPRTELPCFHANCQICGKSCNPAFCLCLDCTYRNGGILQEFEPHEDDLVDIFEKTKHNKNINYMLNLMQIQKT